MWLQPTLNRVETLRNFIDSAIAAETTTPGLILIDEADWIANEQKYKELPIVPGWQFRITQAVSMGDKVREVWNEIEDRPWVGILNDDHYIKTKHWDQKLIAKLDGKNFVHSNDMDESGRGWFPMKATTATLWSMPLLKCVGWPMYPPGLQHLYIDDIWLQLGRATGCYRPVASVIVEHRHVLNHKMAADSTFHKVYDDYFAGKSKDTDVFNMLMKHDFPALVEKIKKFQDKPIGQRYKPIPKKEIVAEP